MKHNVTLTILCLLSILFTTFHLTDDIARGISPGSIWVEPVVILLAIWLYATLALQQRRLGYVLIMIFSLLASGGPILHMIGKKGLSAGIPSSGGFFFAWTLMALGVTSYFCVLLSARQLWNLSRSQQNVNPPSRKEF